PHRPGCASCAWPQRRAGRRRAARHVRIAAAVARPSLRAPCSSLCLLGRIRLLLRLAVPGPSRPRTAATPASRVWCSAAGRLRPQSSSFPSPTPENEGDHLPHSRNVARMATGTPATALLARQKITYTLHPYPHDPRADSYGVEAAAALGVDPGRLFKTLIASIDG